MSCVSDIVANLPLPSGIGTCASSIMSFVRSLATQMPTASPDLSGLDLSACIPSGLPVPTDLLAGMPFMGGGFPFGH